MKTPAEIVELMLENDAFSRWLGIELISIHLGSCELKCIVSSEMLNGFSIAHGGITYSLADSALAFASNSYGQKCVSIETSISHTSKVYENDTLTINANEIFRGNRIGIYEVKILNQKRHIVAIFKGTVNISDRIW